MKHIDHPACWCKRCVGRDIRAARFSLKAWVKYKAELRNMPTLINSPKVFDPGSLTVRDLRRLKALHDTLLDVRFVVDGSQYSDAELERLRNSIRGGDCQFVPVYRFDGDGHGRAGRGLRSRLSIWPIT